MKLKITVTLASALFTLNAFAAPYPFTVESQIDSSNYAFIKPNGSTDLFGAVSWTPSIGNFGFDVLGTPAYATVTNFYTAGNYSTLANSDLFSPPTTISWAVNPGQIGFDGVFSFNGYQTDFVMVWDIVYNGFETQYIAADVDGDGARGFKLVNGAFQGLNFAVDVTTSIPEPETWGLMLSGLAFVGWTARRRNQ